MPKKYLYTEAIAAVPAELVRLQQQCFRKYGLLLKLFYYTNFYLFDKLYSLSFFSTMFCF